MTPPRLLANRPFVTLNVVTLLVYTGLAVMFFLLSFDLIDRRHLTPTDAGLPFLPFTLGVGLLSQTVRLARRQDRRSHYADHRTDSARLSAISSWR